MKKILVGIVVLFVLFAVGVLIIGRTFYPDNIAETSEDGGKKGLKTRFYKGTVSEVSKAAKEVIPELSTYGSNWKIKENSKDHASSIMVEVPVVVFTDDLEILILEANDGEVGVNIRSQSRVGKSDFGENARHVRKLLKALDEKLKN